MTYSTTTTLKGGSAGSAAAILTWANAKGCKRPADVQSYLETVYRLAPQIGLRAEVVVAQSILETSDVDTGAPWASSWWVNRCNPAGIGVTGDPTQDNASRDFGTGEAAALAQLTHLWLYVVGPMLPTGLSTTDDPRWDAAVSAGYAGKADTIAHLANTWAADADYATKIVARLNAMQAAGLLTVMTPPAQAAGGTPVATITYGNVPKPAIVDRVIPDADNWAWNNLGPLDVLGVVYHRQEGTNWGTDGWFRQLWQPNGQPAGGQLGLTSFGLPADGVSSPLMMWNDFLGKARSGVSANRSPWASGPWENPPGGDGHAFVAKYGINAINQKLVAIEIDKFYDDPIADAGIDLIVELSAWLADQKHVPYTDYPINPATGLVFTYTHNEFQNNKPCAGDEVINDIPTIIAKTKDRLEHYQTATSAPPVVTPPKSPYVKPNVPAFLKLWPWVQEVPFNDVTLKLATDLYKDPNGGIKVLAGGMASAKETRAPFAKDETFAVVYEWEKSGVHWGLDPVGNRIDLTKAVRVSEWKPEQIAAPAKTT